jgi:glycosidase
MLALVRRLLEIRRGSAALSAGSYETVSTGHRDVFAYLRRAGDERVLVALNLSGHPRTVDLSAGSGSPAATVLCSTWMDSAGTAGTGHLTLRPDEGLVMAL